MPLYAKLWTDILGDEKLMRAARKGAKHLVILPWLFAFAKKVDDNGRLTVDGEPAEPDDISALIPGVTPRQVAACFEELERIKVLVRDDDGALRLSAWEHRSGAGSKPSDAPESVADRVRKHRLRKKAAASTSANETPHTDEDTLSETPSVTPDVTRSETPSVTPRNADVTSYARSREEEEEKEEEKELEKELEIEKESSSSSGAVAELRSRLTSAAHRATLDRIAATVPSPETWALEMRARLDGMHGPRLTAQQLGDAITDYVGNGNLKTPNFKHFRGYLNNATRPNEPVANGLAKNGNHRTKPNTIAGRAALVFGKIRELTRESQQPGQAKIRFIPKAKVAELGSDVLAAYEAIGGSERVVNATGEQLGFLLRDFTQALEEASHAAA